MTRYSFLAALALASLPTLASAQYPWTQTRDDPLAQYRHPINGSSVGGVYGQQPGMGHFTGAPDIGSPCQPGLRQPGQSERLKVQWPTSGRWGDPRPLPDRPAAVRGRQRAGDAGADQKPAHPAPGLTEWPVSWSGSACAAWRRPPRIGPARKGWWASADPARPPLTSFCQSLKVGGVAAVAGIGLGVQAKEPAAAKEEK